MRETVVLSRSTTRKPDGRAYEYLVLRWYDPTGQRHTKSLGPIDSLSRRQAERARRKKQSELDNNPGRRNSSRAPQLEEFLERYLQVRRFEVREGTLSLHRMTGRYLTAFFGPSRRMDVITRLDARAFRAALAGGELSHISQRPTTPSESTVNLHIRNARKIFAMAMEDDLILVNPFTRLGGSKPLAKAWHEVTEWEFERLMDAARLAWRLLLALTRCAGLRRGEAINLRWSQIDWQGRRLTVIARDDWRPKDRGARVVPIVPALYEILLQAFEAAELGEELVIAPNAIKAKNAGRDFTALCQRAGVKRYAKPFHTLRKTCLTNWARRFPAHVVAAWAGHSSIETTREYYLQVSEAEYERAAAGIPSLWHVWPSNRSLAE